MSFTDIELKILAIINSLLNELAINQLQIFTAKPKVQYCFKGDYILISLIDVNRSLTKSSDLFRF